jgi:hypothetical protein
VTQETPSDPQALRDEIESTRADLADTVEALAAKTNVKARTGDAIAGLADKAKQSLTDAKDNVAQAAQHAAGKAHDAAEAVQEKAAALGEQATQVAAATGEKVQSRVTTAREAARTSDLPALVRKPVAAVIAAGALVFGAIVYLVRRRRA